MFSALPPYNLNEMNSYNLFNDFIMLFVICCYIYIIKHHPCRGCKCYTQMLYARASLRSVIVLRTYHIIHIYIHTYIHTGHTGHTYRIVTVSGIVTHTFIYIYVHTRSRAPASGSSQIPGPYDRIPRTCTRNSVAPHQARPQHVHETRNRSTQNIKT